MTWPLYHVTPFFFYFYVKYNFLFDRNKRVLYWQIHLLGYLIWFKIIFKDNYFDCSLKSFQHPMFWLYFLVNVQKYDRCLFIFNFKFFVMINGIVNFWYFIDSYQDCFTHILNMGLLTFTTTLFNFFWIHLSRDIVSTNSFCVVTFLRLWGIQLKI